MGCGPSKAETDALAVDFFPTKQDRARPNETADLVKDFFPKKEQERATPTIPAAQTTTNVSKPKEEAKQVAQFNFPPSTQFLSQVKDEPKIKSTFVPPLSIAKFEESDTKINANSSHNNKDGQRVSRGLDTGICQGPSRPPKRVNSIELTFDDKYDRGAKLGSGAFASVFVGVDKKTKKQYAVKQIDRAKMQWSGRDALLDEINSLKALREAPYVVLFQDVFLEDASICYLVLELLPGGELFERIIQKGNFTEREARDSCRCVLKALEYMHERRMVHRDLKPENLLLVDTIDINNVKLSDFGFAKKIEKKNDCRTLCGTPGYLAPEVLERWPAYDVKCDTWSFGVILFLLLGGYLPFDAHGSGDVNKVFERTRNGQYHFYPQRWQNVSVSAKDLVAKCLTVNPHNRIGTKAALAHEWMAEDPLNLPATSLFSFESLANTVKTMETARKQKQKMRQAVNQELAGSPANRIEELNDDFTVYMEGRKDDSIVSKMTGAGRTVANQYSMFQEDSPSGKPFANFYKKGDTLGEGGFATVYRCTHKRTGFKYAVKEINSSELSQQEAATLKEEILALQYLRGAPYIIRLYDVFKEPQRTYLILEEMKGGTLLQRIAEKEVYTELEARDLCKILFLAVDYCHKKRIAHRDIKLENLLLVEAGDDSTIKLADFGFAKKCTKAYGLKTMCGTPNYMAPEIFDLKIKGYDHRCDMWSVGVVVFCVLGGYLPFEGKLRDLQKLVIRGEYQFHEMWWKDVSHKAKDLIRCLLQTQPERRYSAEQALAAPWMQLDDGELVYKDLSSTQERMKMMARKKFKNAVNTIIGVTKFTQAVTTNDHVSAMERPESPPMDSIQELEEEEKFEDVYVLGEKIGEGIFASIHLAIHKTTKQEFVVKKAVPRYLHPTDAAALNDEMSVLQAVSDCKHVVRLLEVFETPDYTCLVLEHFKGKALIDCLIQRTKYTEFSAKELIRNLLLGVAHCHKKRIANRNFKLENLLLPPGSETDIRISDFEYAKKVLYPNSLKTQCGTQEYVAPEVLENRPAYDLPCDIWTVGVIIFIMLGGYYPFRGKSEEEVLKKVRYGEFQFHSKYWKGISDEAKSLVKQMMTVDPDQRITAADALQSTWIKADNSILSADLSDNLQELKKELRGKFKAVVKGLIAVDKLRAIGDT